MEEKEFDLRFDTKSGSRDFHLQRRTFIIYNNKVNFLEEGSPMSHWEFCQDRFPEISKEEFAEITRGYYLNGDLVFYKGNFTYDDSVIHEALNYVNEIKSILGISQVKIYFGCVVGKPGETWPLDYYYGDSLQDNSIAR